MKGKAISLQTEVAGNSNILVVRDSINNLKIRAILLFFSVINNEQDRPRNLSIKLTVKKMIEVEEDEALRIIGDFNGHTCILGEQSLDRNGQVILEWTNTYSLILLNSDGECRGAYTWRGM